MIDIEADGSRRYHIRIDLERNAISMESVGIEVAPGAMMLSHVVYICCAGLAVKY